MRYFKPFKIAVACVVLALAGCGGSDADVRPTHTTQILSDPAYDGDIALSTSNTYAVTQGMTSNVQSVFVGIDSVTGSEYRAFLHFPLTGPRGIPGDAIIEDAFLNIYVNSLQPINGSIPIRVDLVNFQPPTLIGTDFNRTVQPALASIIATPDFTRNDVGVNSSIDVTPLMVRAQQLNLQNFQLRILEDLGPAIPVLMEINDTTGVNRDNRAPLLIVTYH